MRLFIKFIGSTVALVAMGVGAHGQTLQEKLLRQSPKLSFNASFNYQGNFQKTTTYQNVQNTSFIFSPRYRITDTYTLVGSLGFAQGLTQENRSDLTNTRIALTRRPISVAGVADVRPTLSLILPTNQEQRERDSLRGALRLTANAFYKTIKNAILTTGLTAQLNNHRFTISARQGANVQTLLQPFVVIGYVLGPFQLSTYSAHSTAFTYRGGRRHRFLLDQSVSYIRSANLSFSLGHTNGGSVLTQDGLGSNVRLWDSRSSTFYLGALYNF